MDKPFFIMMMFPNVPMVLTQGVEDDIAFFETEQEARVITENHHACQHFGYEIFELGTGI